MSNIKTTITIENADFPKGYLAYGYDTAEGKCDFRYVDSYAIEIAAKLAPMNKELFRSFYYEVDLAARNPIDQKQKLLHQLVASAYARVLRNQAPEFFYVFMQRNADVVTDNTSYNDFRDHMEAIYCYMM